MIVEFTIPGNHEGQLKNPTPYHSAQPIKGETKTGKRFYRPNTNPQVLKYNKYTMHVRICLAKRLQEIDRDKYAKHIVLLALEHKRKKDGKIFLVPNKTEIYHLNKIYFMNDARADAENVGKGIIDAIHKQDKYVHPFSPYTYDPERPRVEVLMTTDWEVFMSEAMAFYQKRDNKQKSLFEGLGVKE
jgi:hypothetical protein